MSDSHKAYTSMREHRVLEAVRAEGGACRTSKLAKLLNVSEETIRRNVKRLVAEGVVVKVHGGVLLADRNIEPTFKRRLEENREAKQLMARRVVDFVEDGTSLFLDNGSTTTYVAEALRKRKNLFVVTNSIKVAERLSAHNNNRVYFAGGALRETDGGSYGSTALEFIKGFTPDMAILACSAINHTRGFMLTDMSEAEVARAYIANARATIVVADQTKIGRKGPILITNPEDIATLIVDAPPPKIFANAAAKWGIEVIIANEQYHEEGAFRDAS